jgi:UDP-N-acetylmuramoylalanine--D-glutamate ligase
MIGGFELRRKQVLVIGLARTGVATARFCAEHGAAVTAIDAHGESELGPDVLNLREEGVKLELGAHAESSLLNQDLVIPSPGVPADAPILLAARAKHITVWSEIELADRFLEGRLIGITGSNGKTTTTSLIHHILQTAGFSTILGGNIGTPLISRVGLTTADTVTVAELSSFQLELVETFHPDIAVLLNITPDHLDRHKTFDAYAAAKGRIFEKQTQSDFAVLNADDPACVRLAPKRPQVYWFSRTQEVAQGGYLRGQEIVFRARKQEEVLLRRDEIPLPGAHNVENVLAAATAARLEGAPVAAIAEGVRSFSGVEHRLEFVAEIGGVRYYNDSKATNVDATVKALQAFPGRVTIILGGRDKGSDYTILQPHLRERCIAALLIGEAAEKIAQQVGGSVALERPETLQRAVALASQTAKAGDVVLLAPACASFDQFENYEQRGRVFKELVLAHKQRSESATAGTGIDRPDGEVNKRAEKA